MKKYLLAAGAGLLTTVAVTATVLSTSSVSKKSEVKKEVKKVEKKKSCTRPQSVCLFS